MGTTPDQHPDDGTPDLFCRLGIGTELAIGLHETLCPARNLLLARSSGLIAWTGSTIPDSTLAEVVERVTHSPEESIYSLAERYGYPVELLQCELAIYLARCERSFASRAFRRRRTSG